MKPSQKEIPLSNLGLTVPSMKLCHFNAACDKHNIHYDVENGHFTLILREDSVLAGAFKSIEKNLSNLPDSVPRRDLLEMELSTIEIPGRKMRR